MCLLKSFVDYEGDERIMNLLITVTFLNRFYNGQGLTFEEIVRLEKLLKEQLGYITETKERYDRVQNFKNCPILYKDNTTELKRKIMDLEVKYSDALNALDVERDKNTRLSKEYQRLMMTLGKNS